MTWLRFDDGFADHPKVAALSDAAFRGLVAAICYCGRHLTDGRVLRCLFQRLGISSKAAAELERAGFLERDGDDAVIVHDYLEYQPSRAKVEADRKATQERVTKHRSNGTVTPLQPPHNRAGNTVGNGGCTDAPSHPIPSGSDLPTGEGDPKDLIGQSPGPAPPRALPPNMRNLERSFWPTVELWEGPTPQHRDFARQNGLDVDLEAKQYRANRRKTSYRCADFGADFEEWLAKSLKFARGKANGATW